MSASIQPVAPITVDPATVVSPPAGTTTTAVSGEQIVVTDPNSSGSDPVTITAPATGTVSTAAGAVQSNIIVEGDGTAGVTFGTAETAGGGVLDASGSSFQVSDDYQGTVIANLEGAAVDGTNKVDLTTETPAGNTIADNAPTGATGFDYYIKTGAGNDQIEGSSGNDFIRAGAGDDDVNASGGNDVVRFGTGNDTGFLGAGDDTVYFTVDQLQGTNAKVIQDFDVNGDDSIEIDADLQDLVSISGQGTTSITITLSGAQTGTTTVLSQGETIDDDDIQFV